MPLNTRPFGAASALLGNPWAAPESWQYQPTLTDHNPFPPITLDFSVISTSISGELAEAMADAYLQQVTGDGDVFIEGVAAAAQAHAQIEYVSTQSSETIAGEVAQAIAAAQAAVIATLGPSVTISATRAQAIAEVLPPADLLLNNPNIAAVIAEALAAVIAPSVEVPIAGAVASAFAQVIPPDVVATFVEPPIGGGGTSTGGGSGSTGSGGSPAGFNFGVCAIDFAIDLYVLTYQPFAIAREGPKHEIRTSPRGYALPSVREGRVWRFQWGEVLVDIATVSELRERLGDALRHRFTWTEPDGTPMDIIGSITEIEFSWDQAEPGFYKPVAIRVMEFDR